VTCDFGALLQVILRSGTFAEFIHFAQQFPRPPFCS
jgi:hypothetical protein